MANNNAPFGFTVFGKLLREQLYAIVTAPVINVMHGDIVQSANTGIACTRGHGTRLQVYTAAVIQSAGGATYPLFGAVVSCFDYMMNPIAYIPAGTVGDGTIGGYVMVADDPMQKFMAQEDGVTAAIAVADIDLNFDIASVALSAGNTNTGVSKQQIDSNSSATTSTYPLRLLGMAYPEQDSQGSAGCRWICQINPLAHYWGAGTAV